MHAIISEASIISITTFTSRNVFESEEYDLVYVRVIKIKGEG